jgi:hypothetical protein
VTSPHGHHQPIRLDEVWSFCAARLDDEEQVARRVGRDRIEAVEHLWGTKYLVLHRNGAEPEKTTEFDAPLAEHIAYQEPRRVLARTTFTRSLLAEHEPVLAAGQQGEQVTPMVVCRIDGDDCPFTQGLAALYDDHEDYRERWRPDAP